MIDDTAQKKRIVSSVHDSSHLGVNRTLDLVSTKYYWPGLTKFNDVKHYASDLVCITVLSSYILLVLIRSFIYLLLIILLSLAKLRERELVIHLVVRDLL